MLFTGLFLKISVFFVGGGGGGNIMFGYIEFFFKEGGVSPR
jgi:hypothetical protein